MTSNPGLLWCLTTFVQPSTLAWHVTELLLGGLLLFSLLRATLFALLSWGRTTVAFFRLQKKTLPTPKKLRSAMKRAHITTNSLFLIVESKPQVFCLGFWRPKIFLSQKTLELLTVEELTTALKHEEAHRRHHHGIKLFAAETFREVLWFLPIVNEAVRYLRYRAEVAADQSAAGMEGKHSLHSALQKMLASSDPAWQLAFSGSPASARVETLITGKIAPFRPTWSHIQRSLSASGILFLLVVTLCLSRQPSTTTTAPQYTVHTQNHCSQAFFTPRVE